VRPCLKKARRERERGREREKEKGRGGEGRRGGEGEEKKKRLKNFKSPNLDLHNSIYFPVRYSRV
jgi:hypothetical protein